MTFRADGDLGVMHGGKPRGERMVFSWGHNPINREDPRSVEKARIDEPTSPFHFAHEQQPFVGSDPVSPISEGLELRFGLELIKVHYLGPSQAPDKLVFDFPIVGGSSAAA